MKKSITTLFLLSYWIWSTNLLAQPVITLYFGGTTEWCGWIADETLAPPNCKDVFGNRPSTSTSAIGAPSLITTLAYTQVNILEDTHSEFIRGIGITVNGVLDPLLAAYPSANIFGIPLHRGWSKIISDAENALKTFLIDGNRDNAIVNLVGFSRGGVSAIQFAKYLSYSEYPEREALYNKIQHINILALDPVPGDSFFHLLPLKAENHSHIAEHLTLPSKVKYYVGLYAQDERSEFFAPVIPGVEESSSTESTVLALPGAHETMIGNPWTHGHSAYAGILSLDPIDIWKEISDPSLKSTAWVTKVFAKELLASEEWGKIRFTPDYDDNDQEKRWRPYEHSSDATLQSKFDQHLTNMTSYPDYSYMRRFSFMLGSNYEYYSCAYFAGILLGCAPRAEIAVPVFPLFAPNYSRTLEHIENGGYKWKNFEEFFEQNAFADNALPLLVNVFDTMQYRHKPIAHAGDDQTFFIAAGETVNVNLDGSASYDDDDDILVSYEWRNIANDTVIADEIAPQVNLGIGSHEISLVVSDEESTSESDTVVITILRLGDLNGDSCVARDDYQLLIGVVRAREPYNSFYDINADGRVNIADVRYLATHFTNPRGASCTE